MENYKFQNEVLKSLKKQIQLIAIAYYVVDIKQNKGNIKTTIKKIFSILKKISLYK